MQLPPYLLWELVTLPWYLSFFGQGGYLRNDYLVLIENCRKQFSQIQFNTAAAVGERDAALQAIVDIAKKTLDGIVSFQ